MDQENFELAQEYFSPPDTTGRNPAALRQRTTAGSENFEEDFACSVCFSLAVQPTTLECGHTSCRVCLAQWYFRSKKKECPLCRQGYNGYPQINTQIRNMAIKLCPGKMEERERELNSKDREIVHLYDKELSKAKKNSNVKETDLSSFCAGLAIAVCVVVVLYLAWYWQYSETNLLVLKPVQNWKPKDVATWLKEISWSGIYADKAMENNIDGNMLLTMNEESLQQQLNVTDTTHLKALEFAIDMLKKDGLKMPATLWEYKAIYPGRCLFLMYGMKSFPRTTLLYLWMYFNDDMFIPFVRTTTQSKEESFEAMNATIDNITTSQWVSFLFYAVVMPQWPVVIFAFQMFAHHSVSPICVMVIAITYQLIEYMNWFSFSKNPQWRTLVYSLKQYIRDCLTSFGFMIVWPLMPNLICDILFYGTLYTSPVHGSRVLLDKLRSL